jgi:hypothetical protein
MNLTNILKESRPHNSWLGSKCGFGGYAKNCTFIEALVVAKQDSFSFVRTCAKPPNVSGHKENKTNEQTTI